MGVTTVKSVIVASAIGLALAIAGCSNAGNQPAEPTPQTSTTTPVAPNANGTIPVTPRNEPAGEPLVSPTTPH
jgi:PBP1b-binding outer membrane lipoprotein LpoB